MKIKKLAAILLVVILAFALSMPAMAAGSNNYNSNVSYDTTTGSITPGGTITITPSDNEDLSGTTFAAYKIFDLVDVYTTTGSDTHYAYDLKPAFYGLFAQLLHITTAEVTSEAAYNYVHGKTSAADLNQFGKDVAAYVSTYTASDLVTCAGTASAINYVFSTVQLKGAGLYVIADTTLASSTYNPMAYAVVTNYSDVTIIRKGTTPTITKAVGAGYDTQADQRIGATVPFLLTSAVLNMTGIASYTFKLTDTLSAGLTYNPSSLDVKINGVKVTEGGDYASTFDSTNNVLTITFVTTAWATAYHVGDSIVATYSATINSNAISRDIENNTATVTYSNSPDKTSTSVPSNVEVSELNFKIKKTNDASEPKALAGAEFALYTTASSGASPVYSNAVGFSKGTNSDTYYVNSSGSTVLTSDSNGFVKINGLGAGTYYLVETKAPTGYNLLTGAVTVTVTATLTDLDNDGVNDDILYTATGTNISENSITITNSTGVVLPSTGGIGTTMFKFGGVMIILLAGAFLVVNRKKVFGSGK